MSFPHPRWGGAFSCNPNILKNADFYSAALLCRENKDTSDYNFMYDGSNATAQLMPYWQYYGYAMTIRDDCLQIEHDIVANTSQNAYFCQFIRPSVVANLVGQYLTVSFLEYSSKPSVSNAMSFRKATFQVPSIPLNNTLLTSLNTYSDNVQLEVWIRADGIMAVQFHFNGDGFIKIAAIKLEAGNESTLCYLNKHNTWQLVDIHDKYTTAERCGIRSYQDNMLDNPLFNVNQRDISYGSGIAATSINYPCFRDRWRVYGTSTYLYKYTDYRGVKVKHGKTSTTGIQQRLPSKEFVHAMTYTFSALIRLEEETDRGNTVDGLTNVILSFGDDRDNIIYSKVLTKQELPLSAFNIVSFTFSVPVTVSNDYFNVRIRNGNQNDEIIYTIAAVKLEPGYISTLGDMLQYTNTPTYDNTDYVRQLHRCQRYLQVTYNNDPLIISQDVTIGGAYASTCYVFPARPSVIMASIPTITTQNADNPLFIIESVDAMNHQAVKISDVVRTWTRPCFSITGQSSGDVQRIVNADQWIFWSCEP